MDAGRRARACPALQRPLIDAFTPPPSPFDESAASTHIRVAGLGEERRLCRRAIVLGDGTLVGEVAAYHRTSDRASPQAGAVGSYAELSYVVGAAHRGRGIARRASEQLISSTRAMWSVRDFIARISPENEASVRVARSLGFVCDESTEEAVERKGYRLSLATWRLRG